MGVGTQKEEIGRKEEKGWMNGMRREGRD